MWQCLKFVLISDLGINSPHTQSGLCVITKPWIFLANLRDSKRVQFFYFGIGIIFLTSKSKYRVELLKSNSMGVFATLIFWIRIIYPTGESKNWESDSLGVPWSHIVLLGIAKKWKSSEALLLPNILDSR